MTSVGGGCHLLFILLALKIFWLSQSNLMLYRLQFPERPRIRSTTKFVPPACMKCLNLDMLARETNEHYKRLTLFSKVNRLATSFYNANPMSVPMSPIDLDNDEIIAFLQSLQDAYVKYLLTGGFAVAFHGYVRATHDLDLWIKDDEKNLNALRQVLIQHGVNGLDQVRSFDLIPGFTQFPIGKSGFMVDPMKSLKAFSAFDFDACYERAEPGEFNGVTFKVISAKDLLKEKQATNRLKDLGDIEHLESL